MKLNVIEKEMSGEIKAGDLVLGIIDNEEVENQLYIITKLHANSPHAFVKSDFALVNLESGNISIRKSTIPAIIADMEHLYNDVKVFPRESYNFELLVRRK